MDFYEILEEPKKATWTKQIMSLYIDMQNVIVLHAVKAWLRGLEYFHEIAP